MTNSALGSVSDEPAAKAGWAMTVGTKIFGVVGVCLALLLGVAGLSIWQMSSIGGEIESIAERDMPLAKALTKVTVHQLEQAINFERALRAGLEIQIHGAARKEFDKAFSKFKQLKTLVTEEILEAEGRAQYDIETARTELERQKFSDVFKSLKVIEDEHRDYDKLGLEALELVAGGKVQEAIALLPRIEELEEHLAKTLSAELVEVEVFTENAAKLAEEHEKAAEKMLFIVSILALLGGAGLAWWIVSRNINRPLAEIVAGLEALTAGNTAVEVHVHANDEIGAVATSFGAFKEATIRARQLEADQEQQKQRAENEKREMMANLADEFDSSVGRIVETVATASGELQHTAQTMASVSEETSSQAMAVSTASEEASANVQTVAAAAEELSASIGEILGRITEAAQASQQAVGEVSRTSEQMQSLSDTADKIGTVLGMITDIAEQTNLLALNATIESARAGEMGKGFAVVASEVKNLANQTSNATEEISQQIQEIQAATREAVTSMQSINTVISKVDETSTTIAAAMEEQGAVTQDIARNVQEAATGTSEVSQSINSVTKASQEAGAASDQVNARAGDLSEQSSLLKTEVAKFVAQVRAA